MRPAFLMPCLTLVLAAQAPQVWTTGIFKDPRTGLEVVEGTVDLLPGSLPPTLAEGSIGVRSLVVLPHERAFYTEQDRKAQAASARQAGAQRARDMGHHWQLRRALQTYAKKHEGLGPERLDDPEWLQAYASGKPTPEALKKAQADLQTLTEGFALVPRAPIGQPKTQPGPLFIEVAPLGEGGQWVVDTQGNARHLEQPDKALLAKAGATWKPAQAPPPVPDRTKPLPWRVLALRVPGATEVSLQCGPTDLRPWRLEGPAGQPQLLTTWAYRRSLGWAGAQFEPGAEPSPLLEPMREAAFRVFGKDGTSTAGEARNRRTSEEAGPSLLSLFGGRAAVEETLQLDRELQGSAKEDGKVPLASIQGITVASHPWAKMLGRTRIAAPELARCVPVDRALLLFPDPKAALEELAGGGAGFLNRVSAFARTGSLDHDLIARAQEDLGLGSGLGRRLLEAGGIKEVAVILPDLNLLGGSHLTVAAELTPAATPLVGLLIGETPAAVATPRGQAWRVRLGNRLFLSTAKEELDRVLALHRAKGRGSLGESDEFQVMLARLSPTARTRAYAYFPDAFIRRITGPATRILQMRQAQARRTLEAMTAGVELRRLDAPEAPLDLKALQSLGYLPPKLDLDGYTLDAEGRVVHATWGRLGALKPIPVTAPAEVEGWEAKAYEAFRERYTQYWQRFFDPIAVRLDAGEAGSYQLETFVLPLLDHSAYRALRTFMDPKPVTGEATLPAFRGPVVATLDLPFAWAHREERDEEDRGMLRGLMGRFLPPTLLEGLGDGAHLAFLDAAPVVQVGGGSLEGLLDTPAQIRDGGLMFLAPLVLGPLTRPVVLAAPIQKPDQVRHGLQTLFAMLENQFNPRRDFAWRVHQSGPDQYILSGSVLGLVTLRLGISLEDGWLVVTNDTSLPRPLLAGTRRAPAAHGRIQLVPGALDKGLEAAWQAAMEGEAHHVWADLQWLAPWLRAGLPASQALARSRAVFGAAPLVDPAHLTPQGTDRRFGTPLRPLLPTRTPGTDFGLFQGVRDLNIDLTFEDTGLRTRVQWHTQP